LLGKDHVFTEIAIFFSKMALVTIGGAYAVLAWVGQEAVNGYGWISPQELIDGLALGETTPGPLILVVQFVAFLAGARGETGLSPIVAGTLASIIAVWVTFLPCFLWIFAGAPHADRLLSSPRLSGALMAITAAVIGVMASLALWFAVNSLFGEQVPAAGIAFDLPVLATFRLPAALLSAAAIVAVFRLKTGTPLLLAARLGLSDQVAASASKAPGP
jgi:chromate transporter